MSDRRVLTPAVLVLIALVLTGCKPDPPVEAATAAPARSATASPSPVRTATPTATTTAAPVVEAPVVVATCDTVTTAEHRAQMAANGWISWETQISGAGPDPFGRFPNGAPPGQLVCRWGASADLVTDDVLDLAWSRIDPENAVAAVQLLETEGFVRSDASEGVYLRLPGGSGQVVDAEGFSTTYLFTPDDVRWAPTRADVARITGPVS